MTPEELQRLNERRTSYRESSTKHVDVIGRASFYDPDQVAEDLKLGEDTGLPQPVIDHDRKEARRLQRMQALGLHNLAKRSPKTARWLSEEKNAAIAHDEINLLEEIEKNSSVKSWYEISTDVLEGLGDSMMIGWGKVWDQINVGFLSNPIPENISPEMLERLGKTREELVAEREQQLGEHLESIRVADEEITRLTPRNLSVMEEGVRGGVQMVSDMIPGLAVSAATKGKVNPTLPLLTGKTGLESYGTARVEGLDQSRALTYGSIDAFLEFATEKLPVKYLEKAIGEIGEGGIKGSLKKFLVGEVAGEQLATFTQSMNALAFDLDKELAEAETVGDFLAIQGRRQLVTAISTAVGGGAMSGGLAAVDRVANRKAIAAKKTLENMTTKLKSEQSSNWLDQHISLTQSSNTNKRSANQFAEYLESLDPDMTVYITAESLGELEDLPNSIIEQLDGSGADVTMPLSSFMTEVVPNEQLIQYIRPHVKLDSNLLTPAELEQNPFEDSVKRLIETAEQNQAAKDEADVIFEQVKDQIVGTRRQADNTARQSAELIPAMIVAAQAELASRGHTVSVKELYEKMGLRVVGPQGVEQPDQQEFMEQMSNQPWTLTREQYDAPVELKPAEEFKIKVGQNTVVVYQNPSEQLLRGLMKEVREQYPNLGADSVLLRSTEDSVGNKYYWPAREALHDYIEPDLSRIVGADLNQNMFSGKPSHRSVVRKALYEGKIVPDSVLKEYDGLVEEVSKIKGNKLVTPLKQQNLKGIIITDQMKDEAGNTVMVEEDAQTVWDYHQTRLDTITRLRECLNG